jgi:tetratricopeptide (TPR) repeat protein
METRMRRSILYCATLIICGTAAGIVYQRRDYSACLGTDYETVVSSCTRLSDSTTLTAEIRASALGNRGRAEARENRHDAAIADYDRALELNPAYNLGYYRKAVSLIDTGKPEDAFPLLDKAIELRPPYPHAHHMRGWLYGQRGEYWNAALDYAEAVRMAPSDKDSRHGYAWAVWHAAEAHREAGKPFDADRLVSILPDDGLAYVHRARQPSRDLQQRLVDVDRAIALGHRPPQLLLWRAVTRNALQDKAGAVEDLAAALDFAAKDSATDRADPQR